MMYCIIDIDVISETCHVMGDGSKSGSIAYVLCDLVPYVQFKKRDKHP